MLVIFELLEKFRSDVCKSADVLHEAGPSRLYEMTKGSDKLISELYKLSHFQTELLDLVKKLGSCLEVKVIEENVDDLVNEALHLTDALVHQLKSLNNIISVDLLSNFDEDQIDEIREGLEEGLDVSSYAKPEFDCYQMEEIRKGLENKLDVSSYADPKFDSYQMAEIRYGLEEDLDVSIYADPKFSDSQMYELRIGLWEGVDVSEYADPDLGVDWMRDIREGLLGWS